MKILKTRLPDNGVEYRVNFREIKSSEKERITSLRGRAAKHHFCRKANTSLARQGKHHFSIGRPPDFLIAEISPFILENVSVI